MNIWDWWSGYSKFKSDYIEKWPFVPWPNDMGDKARPYWTYWSTKSFKVTSFNEQGIVYWNCGSGAGETVQRLKVLTAQPWRPEFRSQYTWVLCMTISPEQWGMEAGWLEASLAEKNISSRFREILPQKNQEENIRCPSMFSMFSQACTMAHTCALISHTQHAHIKKKKERKRKKRKKFKF